MTSDERIETGYSASAGSDKADLVNAYQELMKAEKAASALEKMLDSIDSKLDDILTDETFLQAERELRLREQQAQP